MLSMPNQLKFDVIIVGSGPAGAIAAHELARSGKSVAIIDKSEFPRKKLCGGLLPGKCIDLLLDIYQESGFDHSILDTTFDSFHLWHKDYGHICKCGSPGLAMHLVDRFQFDKYLLDKALDQGCLFYCGKVVSVVAGVVTTETGSIFRGSHIIGADGANSVVRKSVQSKPVKDLATVSLEIEVPRSALRPQHAARTADIHFAYNQVGYGWVFHRKDKSVIGMSGHAPHNRNIRSHLKEFCSDVLAEDYILQDSEIEGFIIPTGNLTDSPALGNVVLVGDAAGLVEPLTGEGIYFAMKSGQIAGRMLAKDHFRPAEYNRAIHKAISRNLSHARLARKLFYSERFFSRIMRKMQGDDTFGGLYFELLANKLSYFQYARKVLSLKRGFKLLKLILRKH